MKKYILIALIISGCGSQTAPEVTPPITQNSYIKQEISVLQEQIDQGLITELQAQTRLQDLIKLNDGSVQSILKKMELQSPGSSTEFERRIRENHPELFIEE